MKKLAPLAVAFVAAICVAPVHAQNADVARWEKQAAAVTIIRDDWGIAHVYGKTDADAVFGMIYAQAEDDFNRVESNYLTSLGRRAEAEGEAVIFNDLRAKIYANPDSLKKMFAASPAWLQKLMVAWADGLNFYLYKHPEVKPKVITRFESWMPLSFSEGSIGGDIERISVPRLRAFYGGAGQATSGEAESRELEAESHSDVEPRGSNGIAISPKNTVSGNALLYINPHTSFYFRSELQMVSEEGLNAYGAATWGQFFIYQGFNANAGWMHTSSGVDNIDEFAETIVKKGDKYFYKHGAAEKPVLEQKIAVPYKTATGMATKEFTTYRTHHGPVVREQDGKWISVSLMDIPVQALTQSYGRTKSKSMADFIKYLDTHSNSSNNTLFADNSGNIAYFHANYIPRRDTSFDWTRPVDGSNPATDYKGVLSVNESPNSINPASGWTYNSNNWPWTASGPSSPKRENFPKYVETAGENARGLHALKILPDKKDFTRDNLITTAFDSYQPGFERIIPELVKAWDGAAAGDLKTNLAEPVAVLRPWDLRWSASSVANSIAVFYADELGRSMSRGRGGPPATPADTASNRATDSLRLAVLNRAVDKLTNDFGKWQTPWGDINRFQRVKNELVATFDDNAPSIPVMFTSARWGSLASFGARQYDNTKKWYGTSGNSFLASVEFGKDSVRARAVTAGGESGSPASKHFNDQAERYATGNFRTVYYYKAQLTGHIEREYHPGQ